MPGFFDSPNEETFAKKFEREKAQTHQDWIDQIRLKGAEVALGGVELLQGLRDKGISTRCKVVERSFAYRGRMQREFRVGGSRPVELKSTPVGEGWIVSTANQSLSAGSNGIALLTDGAFVIVGHNDEDDGAYTKGIDLKLGEFPVAPQFETGMGYKGLIASTYYREHGFEQAPEALRFTFLNLLVLESDLRGFGRTILRMS